MKERRRYRESGYGLMEFSALFSLVAVLLFGLWGFVSMLQVKRSVETEVQKALLSHSLPVWRLNEGVQLSFNSEVLNSHVEGVARELFERISNLHTLAPGQEVYVESALAHYDIGTSTGKVVGELQLQRAASFGNDSFLPLHARGRTDFEAIFARFNKTISGERSMWAIPFRNNLDGQRVFFPQIFFVGLRAYVEAEGFAGWMQQMFNQEPVYFASHATVLRGEVIL